MALSETLKKPVSGEELFKMGDIGRCELVKGEIKHMSPAGGRHGELTNWIGTLLANHVRPRKLGKVYGAETGFYTQRNPDTVRAPDAMFISNERVERIGNPIKFLDVSPDLAVEVLSPDDTWTEVETKVEEYVQAGVRLIWILDPDRRLVVIYRPSGERTQRSESDLLSGEDILPEFSISVAQIFEEIA